MRMQQIHGHVRQTGHDGVKDVQNRGDEDKGKFNRLGDPRQEAGERRRE